MKKLIIGSVVALTMASTSAMAQSAASSRHGSTASGPEASADSRQDRMHNRRNSSRDDRRAERAPRNSASTYGAGSVYTDRHRATGAVATGGRASGVGSQSASSVVDAYAANDRNGSTGEVYGDSSAVSNDRGR